MQLCEPASCAFAALSAVARATGFGCDVTRVHPVWLAGSITVTVTEPPTGMSPKLQVSKWVALMLQLPWLVVTARPGKSAIRGQLVAELGVDCRAGSQ